MPQAFPDGVPEWAEGMGTPKLEYLTEQAENAALNPADENGFKRYHANIKVTSIERAIPPALWSRCDGELEEWPLQSYGGFDLGRSDDWAAAAVIAKIDETESGQPIWQIKAQTWCAAGGSVDLKTHPFREWVSSGRVRVCTGESDRPEWDEHRKTRRSQSELPTACVGRFLQKPVGPGAIRRCRPVVSIAAVRQQVLQIVCMPEKRIRDTC